MKTTTSTKSPAKRALPKRDPKTGRFEKAAAKLTKPDVAKTKKT